MGLTAIDSQIDRRFKNALSRLRAVDGMSASASDELMELRESVAIIGDLLERRASLGESGGNENHPLGATPHLNTKLLFHLDRCEVLLKAIEHSKPPADVLECSASDGLVYPSLRLAVLRRFFAFLVHCRKRMIGRGMSYEAPPLREVLYLKCPFWMEPVLRRLLFRTTRR